MLILIENLGIRYQVEELNTGVYIKENFYSPELEYLDPALIADKHEIDYRIWIIQVAVWGMIVAIVKVLIFIILHICSAPLELIVGVLLGWLNIYPNLKLLLIMMIIPLILNAIQFWVQDNILKAKKETNFKFVSFSMMEKCKSVSYYKEMGFEDGKISKKSNSFIASNGNKLHF